MDSYQMTLNRDLYFRRTLDPQEPLVQGTNLEQKPQECTKSGCCVLSRIPSCFRSVPLVPCCLRIHSPRLPLELMWKDSFSLGLIRLHVQGFASWKCLLCELQREPESSSSSYLVASLQSLMVSGATVVLGVSYSKAPAECSSSVCSPSTCTQILGLFVLVVTCGEIPSKLEPRL